jgi:hypothetical protein
MKALTTFTNHHKALNDNAESVVELQKQQASIVTGKHADEYLNFITNLAKSDMKSVARGQTCINKATTQRYILGVNSDEKLTEQFRMKRANTKLLGEGLCTQADIDSKKYFYFTTPIKAKPVPTADGDLQKTVDEFAITKEQYLAFGEKLVFPVVQ